MKKAIIIGSGIGGIATALRLNAKGIDVYVFEKNKYPGGKLSTFKMGEFRFDAGPSLFTMPHYVDELFELYGVNPRIYFNYKRKRIACKYFWDDGKIFNAFSDTDKFIDECIDTFKIKRETITKYIKKAKKKYDLTEGIFLKKSLNKLSSFLNYDTLKALFRINLFQINESLNSVNKKELKNDYLVQFYNRFATYNGSSPYKTPGMMTLIQHLESHYGTYIPEGGMNEITKSLYKLAEDKGVKFFFNSDVSEIIIKDDVAKGIRIGHKIHNADYVISNSDVYNTYKNLLKDEYEHKSLEQERSSSAVIYYWGINKKFNNLDLHNIFFSKDYKKEFEFIFDKKLISNDPTIYVNITSKDVKNDAPSSGENWFVMINSPYDNGQDWIKIKNELKKIIIQKIKGVLGEDISNFIVEEKIYTPVELENNTYSHKGSLYGISSNNKFSAFLRHPNFLSNISNLYFCGGSVHPGGGIPLCLLSAKIVSDLIKK